MPNCSTRQFQAVVFDLDGVLVDTETGYRAIFRDVLAGFGLACPDALHHRLAGIATPERPALLATALPGLPVKAFLAAYAQRKAALLAAGVARKPDAAEVLAALRGRHVKVAVATSASRRTARLLLDRAGLPVATIATRDDVARGKPAPDVYLHAASLLGLAPAACLAVEDSPTGIRAARAAGMGVVMVPDLIPPTPEIAAMCHAIVPRLRHIPPLVRGREPTKEPAHARSVDGP